MSGERIESQTNSRAGLRLVLVTSAYVVGAVATWLVFR